MTKTSLLTAAINYFLDRQIVRRLNLILILLLLPSISWGKDCQVKPIDKYSYSIEIGNKTISIFGWLHPNDSGLYQLSEIFGNSSQNCIETEKDLDQFLAEKKDVLNHGKRIHELLKKDKYLFTLATERAEDEQDKINSLSKQLIKKGQQLSQKCPQLKNKIINSLLVFPGPELYHSHVYLKKPVLAVESRELLDEAQDNFPVWAAQNDHLYAELPDKTKILLKKINVMGYKPSTEYHNKIFKTLINPLHKRYVNEYLDYNTFLLNQSKKRNDYIIKKLLLSEKNVGFIVGYQHNEDLKIKLISECIKQNSKLNYNTQDTVD